MNEKENKKKVIIPIAALVIAGLITILIGTYAYWQVTRKQTNRNLVGSACLSITFSNETGDINLQNMFPTSETEINDNVKYPPYSFTITNTCDVPVSYTVALESIEDDNVESTDYLDYKYLRVRLDSGISSIYNNLEQIPDDDDTNLDYNIRTTKKIINKKLGAGQSRTHYLKLWLDESTPLNDNNGSNTNKYFFGKIKIIAGQGIEADCYTVDSEGVLTAYDSECGRSATIPAEVNGTPVKKIATNAFKGVTPDYTYTSQGDNVQGPYMFKYLDPSYEGGKNCKDSAGNQVSCTLDYSVVLSSKAAPLFELGNDPDAMAQIVPTLTPADIYIIRYNNDPTTSSYSHIAEAVDAELDELVTSISSLGLTFGKNDVITYPDGSAPDEGDGVVEIYYSVTKRDEGWASKQLGEKFPAGTSSSKLVIDSLDLTQATNLERIDHVAFSNYPDLNQYNSFNETSGLNNIPYGLKALKYDNKLYDVSLGGVVFGYSDLDNLTLTTADTFTIETTGDYSGGVSAVNNWDQLVDKNDFYALLNPSSEGAFNGSHIKNLTVTPSQGDTTLDDHQFQHLIAIIDNLIIANGITEVAEQPFWGTEITRSLSLPNTLTSIGRLGFNLYKGDTLTIPGSVTTIGESAFDYFKGNSLILNEGIQTIGRSAFLYYSNDVTIPYSVTSIGDYAFASLGSDDTVTIKRAQNDVPYDVTSTSAFGYYTTSNSNNNVNFVYDPN